MYLFYYLFFAFCFGAKMIGLYDGQKPFYVLVGIGLLFYLIKLLTTKMSTLEFIFIAAVMGMSALVYLMTGEKGLILCMAIVTGIKGVDSTKLIKFSVIEGTVLFLIMVLLTSLGIVPDVHHITEKFGGQLLRRDFGQPSCNVTHTVLFVLISMAIFLYGDGAHLFKLSVFMMILNICCFAYTLSITGFLSITFLLAINLFFLKIKREFSSGIILAANVIFAFIILLSIVSPIIIKGAAFDFINKILNHRLEYGKYYLLNERITLLGSRFAPAPNTNFYLDNSFQYLFLQLGVVTFVITLIVLFIGVNGMLKAGDKGAFILFVAYTFIGLSDPFLFNTSFKNITLIFVGKYMFDYLAKLGVRYGLKSRCIINISSREVPEILKRIKTRVFHIDSTLDGLVQYIVTFFDNKSNLLLLLFVLAPLVGVGAYFFFPQLYDISLLAEGDRLVYDFEFYVQLNNLVNKELCILRTGILDGIFFAIALTVITFVNWSKRWKEL